MPPKPALKRPAPTHFLCIPLVTAPSLARWRLSMDAFRADATGVTPGGTPGGTINSSPDSGPRSRLPDSAIRPLHSVHLTLGVMSLDTAEKLDGARAALEGLDVRALLRAANDAAGAGGVGGDGGDGKEERTEEGDESDAPAPLIISLKSLQPMQSASSTSVLYTQPADATSRLLPFCISLVTHFTSAGIMTPDTRPLKLHATVLNTLQARKEWVPKKKKKLPAGWGRPDRNAVTAGDGKEHGDEGTEKGAIDANGKIDGRELIARWADHTWVDGLRLEKVAICEMGAKLDERDGVVRYREVASVGLP